MAAADSTEAEKVVATVGWKVAVAIVAGAEVVAQEVQEVFSAAIARWLRRQRGRLCGGGCGGGRRGLASSSGGSEQEEGFPRILPPRTQTRLPLHNRPGPPTGRRPAPVGAGVASLASRKSRLPCLEAKRRKLATGGSCF